VVATAAPVENKTTKAVVAKKITKLANIETEQEKLADEMVEEDTL
jgi:hypothetical protein